ncbi:MAG TPA: glycosyltransferase family 1 protein [Bacteroidia bacterium]|nr:glycosyltransferase family 1 protein [Bacteroidia bacterium]
MKKLKVLVEMEKLKNLNSGLGQFCLGLGQALVNQNKNNDLHFLVPENKKGIFGNHVFYNNIKNYLSFLFKRPKSFDIWHCTHQQSKFLLSSGKLILTIHDLNFLYKYKGIKKLFKMNALQRKVNKASAIVAISQFTANEIKQHLNINDKKLHVIYNGVSLKSIENVELPSFLRNRKYLFSIGIINPKKNFHVLLPLLKNNANLFLVIAGNSTHQYVQKIKSMAQEMGVLTQLYFLGIVSDDLKYTLYKNCYAFVFPSLSEGFGLPVIEAMIFGKPVFLSNKTCLPEIGGSEAFYWENFEASDMQKTFEKGMKIYNDDNLKTERIMQHASQFNWEIAAKKYLALYESI